CLQDSHDGVPPLFYAGTPIPQSSINEEPPVLADLQPGRVLGSTSPRGKGNSDEKQGQGAGTPHSHGSLSFHCVYSFAPHPTEAILPLRWLVPPIIRAIESASWRPSEVPGSAPR